MGADAKRVGRRVRTREDAEDQDNNRSDDKHDMQTIGCGKCAAYVEYSHVKMVSRLHACKSDSLHMPGHCTVSHNKICAAICMRHAAAHETRRFQRDHHAIPC